MENKDFYYKELLYLYNSDIIIIKNYNKILYFYKKYKII